MTETKTTAVPKAATLNTPSAVATKSLEEAKEPLENRIRDTSQTYSWTVVGLNGCKWAEKAVSLLKEHKENVKFIPINTEWQRRLIVEYGTNRTPAIVRNNRYFGCYSDLVNYYECSFISDSERF